MENILQSLMNMNLFPSNSLLF